MSAPAAKRAVAESCIDFLTLELVNNYRRQLQGPPLQAALDAIGERVGRQLVERYSKDRPPLLEQVGAVERAAAGAGQPY
jgi:hypothetical protein